MTGVVTLISHDLRFVEPKRGSMEADRRCVKLDRRRRVRERRSIVSDDRPRCLDEDAYVVTKHDSRMSVSAHDRAATTPVRIPDLVRRLRIVTRCSSSFAFFVVVFFSVLIVVLLVK
jgi:hypothetical protein